MEMKVSQVGCLQITGRWISYSIFFDIAFIVFFTRLFSKGLWANYPFSAQISKIHFKIYYWNGGPLNISWKICPFLGLFFQKQKCWRFKFSWIKYFGNDFSFLIKWRIWDYYCWNYGPSNLKGELKTDFWLQIGIFLRKTVQDIVLDGYVRQIASSQVTSFWCF